MIDKPNIIASRFHWWDEEDKRRLSKLGRFLYLFDREALNEQDLINIDPEYIFFIHWSWMVPKEIHNKFKCIVFHMTDLPYGRGGSPLQNLIALGHKETKISAIRMTEELDAGPIYMKHPLSLEGSANEIFKRASKIIFEMIAEIIQTNPDPVPQEGSPTIFKRRTPEMSIIPDDINDIEKIYDHIRMLDAPGYPPAYIRHGNFLYEFSDASFNRKEELLNAQVRIRKAKDSTE